MSNPERQHSPTIDFDDRIIPLAEVARAADLSMATLRRRIADGSGPKITKISERRIGVRGRHFREWLDALVASHIDEGRGMTLAPVATIRDPLDGRAPPAGGRGYERGRGPARRARRAGADDADGAS